MTPPRTSTVMARPATFLAFLPLLVLLACRRETKPADAPSPSSSGVVSSSSSATPTQVPSPALSATPPKEALGAPTACRDALLTGSIGANPIVMELRICGEAVGGRYYYRRN